MKSILDKSFKYTPSFETDIRKRFDRVRRAIAEKAKQPAPPNNVKQLKRVVG